MDAPQWKRLSGRDWAVERQRQYRERIAWQRGWTVAQTYTDNSISDQADRRRGMYARIKAAVARAEVERKGARQSGGTQAESHLHQ